MLVCRCAVFCERACALCGQCYAVMFGRLSAKGLPRCQGCQPRSGGVLVICETCGTIDIHMHCFLDLAPGGYQASHTCLRRRSSLSGSLLRGTDVIPGGEG